MTVANNKGDFVTVELLNGVDTESFETACRAAGARFIGGVLACVALAERDLVGTETYHGYTPYDTRTPGIDTMTVGWFASLVPVTVPTGTGSFREAARAAQNSFDVAKHLAGVPIDRVLELATPDQLEIKPPTRPAMMVSFIDFRKIPVAALLGRDEFRYLRRQSVARRDQHVDQPARRKTTVTISFPDNPVARESVHRYIAALREVFVRAVESTSDWVNVVAEHANSGHAYLSAATTTKGP